MKHSKNLKNGELSKETVCSLEHIQEKLIVELINDYEKQLLQDGYYLTEQGKRLIKSYIKPKSNIKLTVDASVTEEMLEKWYIYPVEVKQSLLTSFPEGISSVKFNGEEVKNPDELAEKIVKR
ncbi:hypothetical protein [Methanosarcina sp.]|uniref:hypothetical protein n=1 Tax=Methanosarcina sp. TaxID=2213 RepID=UPI003BB6A152